LATGRSFGVDVPLGSFYAAQSAIDSERDCTAEKRVCVAEDQSPSEPALWGSECG